MTNELVIIEQNDIMKVFTEAKGLDAHLAPLRALVESFHCDATTEKGRKEIKSFCYKLARSKTHIDSVGKELTAKLKEQPKLVDAERKRVRDLIDQWSEDCRKPLAEYEAKEKQRIDFINDRLDYLKNLSDFSEVSHLDSDLCKEKIKELGVKVIFDEFDEFKDEAETLYKQAISSLQNRLFTIEREEFKAEKEEREKQIALEAEKIEAAKKLEANRIALEEKIAEEKAASEARAVEAEKQRAILQARLLEQQQKNAADEEIRRVEQDKQIEEARVAKIESDRVAAINEKEIKAQKLRTDKIEAELFEAKKAEQSRLEEQAELDKRSALSSHKKEILLEALEDAKKVIDEEPAKLLLRAIAEGKIENVSINY